MVYEQVLSSLIPRPSQLWRGRTWYILSHASRRHHLITQVWTTCMPGTFKHKHFHDYHRGRFGLLVCYFHFCNQWYIIVHIQLVNFFSQYRQLKLHVYLTQSWNSKLHGWTSSMPTYNLSCVYLMFTLDVMHLIKCTRLFPGEPRNEARFGQCCHAGFDRHPCT